MLDWQASTRPGTSHARIRRDAYTYRFHVIGLGTPSLFGADDFLPDHYQARLLIELDIYGRHGQVIRTVSFLDAQFYSQEAAEGHAELWAARNLVRLLAERRRSEGAVPVTPPLSAMSGTPDTSVTPPLCLTSETQQC